MGNVCECCTSPPSHAGSPPPSHAGSPPPSPSPEPPIISSPAPSIPTTSSPPPASIDSLKLLIQEVNPTDQIDLLINFIEDQLQGIKASPEKASTASSLLNSVAPNISLAAKIVDTISTEADKLSETDIAKEIGGIALRGLEMVGKAHWIFIGLSVAAYALERCVTARSNVSGCIDLLEKICILAKDLNRFKEAMPGESKGLCKAVQIIVEGVLLCCDYISKGRLKRYWSAASVQDFLKKANESIQYITSSLTFTTVTYLQRQKTLYIEPSLKLLGFKPVGIEKQVSDVEELLNIQGSEAAVAVILLGNGGAGKTTLASQVIQQLDLASAGFKFCRVIIDDQTPDKRSHITKLQRDIIHDLRGDKIHLRDPLQGQNEIQKTIQNNFCFLFIDNVVDSDCIKQLLPRDLLLEKKDSQKLRIVITSRESNLPSLFNDINCKEYPVNSLSDEAAKMLLRETILKDGTEYCPGFDEERLVNDVAVACKGIPLLLSVYGNHLRVARKEDRYQGALDSLRKGDINRFSEDQIEEKLLFVYDKLKDFNAEAQEAFLDICSYFHGWSWDTVSDIVDKTQLETLQKRMLVSRSEINNQVIVHGILLLMGRKKAKNTRFLNSNESLKALQDKSNLQNVKGISLLDGTSSMALESSDLNAMHSSLRVLQLGAWVEFEGSPCNVEFENLRCLRVEDINVFPFEDALKLNKLAVFHNQSKPGIDLPQLPGSLKEITHNVRQLDAIAKLPQGLKLPALLRHLRLSNFELVPQTLSHLNALEYLSLDKCDIKIVTGDLQEQKQLPEGLKLPVSLRNLIMKDCKQVPQTLSHLNALEELIFYNCGMEIMPLGFQQLTKLKTLSLEDCKILTDLPPVSGSKASLTSVNLRGCTSLQGLPADFGMLSALNDLCLKECSNLTALPDNVGGLSSLQELDINHCSRLQRLPETFGSLSLQRLQLQDLDGLEQLPETIGDLAFLKFFEINNCPSLTSLPGRFVQLTMLETLHIDTCINLGGLPKNFGRLTSLKKIFVNYCPSLKELPHGFEALTALKELHLQKCSKLESLPECFEKLACLEGLTLKSLLCSKLPNDLRKLKNLRELRIWDCPKLKTLPDGLEEMVCLNQVIIQYCGILEAAAIQRIVKLKQCYFVDISGSPELVDEWKKMQKGEEKKKMQKEEEKKKMQKEEEKEKMQEEKEKIYPFMVVTSAIVKKKEEEGEEDENYAELDEYEWHRAAKVGLFHGRCKQLDKDELKDYSSITVRDNTTVAVISHRVNIKHSLHLQKLADKAMERAKLTSPEKLIVIYLRKAELDGQATEDTEEEKRIREVLKRLPEKSYVIPCSETRRLLLIQHLLFTGSVCFIADLVLDDEGRQIFDNEKYIKEDEILGRKLDIPSNQESENVDDLTRYMHLISSGRKLQCTWKEFAQSLRDSNIRQFDSREGPVEVDQLEGKVVALITCDIKSCECVILQQIYDHLHGMHVDFEAVWISSASYGRRSTYMRAIQHMPGVSFHKPNFVYQRKKPEPRVILFVEGIISNQNALTAIIAWGGKAYPFTDSKIREVVSNMHTKSSLESLLHGMDFQGPGSSKMIQPFNNKLIFLYAEPPNKTLKMKSKLEQLVKLYENIEIFYVGTQPKNQDADKKEYENATKDMHWNKLSFWDMVKFWYCCQYVSNKEEEFNSHMTLQELVKHLKGKRWLVLLDSDGIVTASGIDVVDYMIDKSNDKNISKIDIMINELIKNLNRGKCPQMAKTFFKDEVSNYPDHDQHHLFLRDQCDVIYCDVCQERKDLDIGQKRVYSCEICDWNLCRDCWEVFAKEQI